MRKDRAREMPDKSSLTYWENHYSFPLIFSFCRDWTAHILTVGKQCLCGSTQFDSTYDVYILKIRSKVPCPCRQRPKDVHRLDCATIPKFATSRSTRFLKIASSAGWRERVDQRVGIEIGILGSGSFPRYTANLHPRPGMQILSFLAGSGQLRLPAVASPVSQFLRKFR